MRIILKVSVLAVALAACPPAVKPESGADEKRALLGRLTAQVVVPTAEGFATEASALALATATWAAARATGAATAEHQAARDAFRAAFLRWQRLEMLALGPAGALPTFTHGQGLRDTIYSWPTVNPCRVDTVLVEQSWAQAGFIDTALVTSSGLGALEQLLFVDSAANACPTTASINTTGGWAALSADELGRRRAAYAAAAAAALEAQAVKLRDAWTGGVQDKFARAGLAGSGFPTAQAALDQVFAAMFSADNDLKDDRVGGPAGLTTACAAPPCPELAEARAAGLSREAIAANLDALAALMHGRYDGAGEGFDAMLEARGAGGLSAEMLAALQRARTGALALPTPLDVAVTTDLLAVQLVHADVKAFTDLLKSQFVTVLSLTVPAEGAGDAD